MKIVDSTSESRDIPHLRQQGSTTQLIVDGRPLLVIGGELHNSSSSSLAYMQPIWERLVGLGLNTVLAAISWELIEPDEGEFDFALVDGLILEARRYGLRLVLLWFGSWKNGESTYIPPWVKRDYQRFPRARRGNGQSTEVLSTVAEANWQADSRAFAALMRRIRQVDGEAHTVIMVQVENEVGLLGDSRDRGEAATAAFADSVPQTLIDALQADQSELWPGLRERWEAQGSKNAGNWEAVFGASPETDELFMAWNYARYIDHVAETGKAEYDLPMYVNAWLNAVVELPGLPAGGQAPGDWPSGGPLPHTQDIWRAAAPHIDMLSPDIYFGDFKDWCRQYRRRGNPLFVPEMRRDDEGARNVIYAIAQHDAIGTAPFGIDSLISPADQPLIASYRILRQLAPLILAHQGSGRMVGFVLDAEHPSVTIEMNGYELTVSQSRVFGTAPGIGYGLVIATQDDTFVGAGYGFQVGFKPLTPGPAQVGLAVVIEGEYRDGQWIPLRRLNGDERNGWTFPAAGPSLSTFSIALVGAGSGIACCTVYRYE